MASGNSGPVVHLRQNPQRAEGKRKHKPTMKHSSIPNGSFLSLPGQSYSINMAGIYHIFHPSLQDWCTRDEPQACCLCSPEDTLIKCLAAVPGLHITPQEKKKKEPFWRWKLFSYLILIGPVEEKSLWVCSEDNWSHNSGVLAEKGQTKNPCQHREHIIMHKLLCHPC